MTESERKRIYGLSKKLGMNSDELHLLVKGVTECESIRELDKAQTYEVIRELSRRLDSVKSQSSEEKTKKTSYVPGMITPAQQNYCWKLIYRLAELDPREKTPGERMCGAIQKILGVTAMVKEPFAWVSFEQGRDLIEGLKRYVASAERKKMGGK